MPNCRRVNASREVARLTTERSNRGIALTCWSRSGREITSIIPPTPWVWLWCERCQHHAPLACAVAVILWKPDASSDKLRAGARLRRKRRDRDHHVGVDFDQGNRNSKCLLGYNNEAAPRQGAAFLFMLFARQADSAEPCAFHFFMFPSISSWPSFS